MSDLHLEHMRKKGREEFFSLLPPRRDTTLVLAGDIVSLAPHNYDDAIELFERFIGLYERVIYVPGNHEHYGSDVHTVRRFLISFEATHPTFHALRTGRVLELNGHRFLGDTMWFRSHQANKKFERFLSDFRWIHNVDEVYLENTDFRKFLEANLKQGDVVITHHLPATGSVATEYKGDHLNRFFISNEESLIMTHKPGLWVHGHTHNQFDYTFGKTRIVANPRGYPNEYTQKGWEPAKIIELP